jgi:glycosyltransferase EpsD
MSKESKRVLIIATVVKTHVMQFHIPTLKLFKEMGWETAVAARNDYENPADCQIPYCDHFYDVPFERFPFMPKNIACYKKLKDIIDLGDYRIIHCHTPVGGVLGRLAARKSRKKGTRVLYTAHGFHFYRGAPLKNWLLYYPVERACAGLADAVITINQEDLHLARKRFRNTSVYYLPGIGVDVEAYSKANVCKADVRKSLGIGQSEKLIISVGEVNDNKNQKTIIQALTFPEMRDVHYLIVGDGNRRIQTEAYAAELNVRNRVHFLGYCNDIASLLHVADVFVFPSYREGLPVAVMEAMAAGIPVIASRIRGNVDLIEDGVNGFLCDPRDAAEFADRIQKILENPGLAEEFRKTGLEKIIQHDIKRVTEKIRCIYSEEG